MCLYTHAALIYTNMGMNLLTPTVLETSGCWCWGSNPPRRHWVSNLIDKTWPTSLSSNYNHNGWCVCIIERRAFDFFFTRFCILSTASPLEKDCCIACCLVVQHQRSKELSSNGIHVSNTDDLDENLPRIWQHQYSWTRWWMRFVIFVLQAYVRQAVTYDRYSIGETGQLNGLACFQ